MTVFKRTILAATVVVTSIIIVFIAYSASYKTPPSEPKTKSKIITTAVKYTVKSYNGKIAVFENDDSEPTKVLESPYIRDLPETDQKLLSQGITANDINELNRILEDYDN